MKLITLISILLLLGCSDSSEVISSTEKENNYRNISFKGIPVKDIRNNLSYFNSGNTEGEEIIIVLVELDSEGNKIKGDIRQTIPKNNEYEVFFSVQRVEGLYRIVYSSNNPYSIQYKQEIYINENEYFIKINPVLK